MTLQTGKVFSKNYTLLYLYHKPWLTELVFIKSLNPPSYHNPSEHHLTVTPLSKTIIFSTYYFLWKIRKINHFFDPLYSLYKWTAVFISLNVQSSSCYLSTITFLKDISYNIDLYSSISGKTIHLVATLLLWKFECSCEYVTRTTCNHTLLPKAMSGWN